MEGGHLHIHIGLMFPMHHILVRILIAASAATPGSAGDLFKEEATAMWQFLLLSHCGGWGKHRKHMGQTGLVRRRDSPAEDIEKKHGMVRATFGSQQELSCYKGLESSQKLPSNHDFGML